MFFEKSLTQNGRKVVFCLVKPRSKPVSRRTAGAALNAPVPLVPPTLLVPLWFAALALPNLVYSGVSFYDTLHVKKIVSSRIVSSEKN